METDKEVTEKDKNTNLKYFIFFISSNWSYIKTNNMQIYLVFDLPGQFPLRGLLVVPWPEQLHPLRTSTIISGRPRWVVHISFGFGFWQILGNFLGQHSIKGFSFSPNGGSLQDKPGMVKWILDCEIFSQKPFLKLQSSARSDHAVFKFCQLILPIIKTQFWSFWNI